jgi:hypothetical protein
MHQQSFVLCTAIRNGSLCIWIALIGPEDKAHDFEFSLTLEKNENVIM